MLDITITKYLTIFLGTYYTLDTVLGTEDKTVNLVVWPLLPLASEFSELCFDNLHFITVLFLTAGVHKAKLHAHHP